MSLQPCCSWALRLIDNAISRAVQAVGQIAAWGVVIAILVAVGNAIARKFGLSSNAWLETQWYLLATVVMLGAAWVTNVDGHVRIDVLATRWSQRRRDIIEISGNLLLLLPFVVLMIYLTSRYFWMALVTGERSGHVGGLPMWPVRLVVVLGFSLLLLEILRQTSRRLLFVISRKKQPRVS